ncbi:hypothetical protein M3231_06405 [Neobacillus mesonae]|nr:hypothetical protein [Neobacillus mesonae]
MKKGIALIRKKKSLILVPTLVLFGFSIGSVSSDKAFALLNDVVDPILSVQSSDTTNNSDQRNSSLKVNLPSIQVNTPVLDVKLPEIDIKAGLNKEGISAGVSEIKVEAPLVKAETSSLQADVSMDQGLLPETRVKAPSVKAELPANLKVETSELKAEITDGNGVPEVKVNIPSVKADASIIKVETSETEAHISHEDNRFGLEVKVPEISVDTRSPVSENPIESQEEPKEPKTPADQIPVDRAPNDKVNTEKVITDRASTVQNPDQQKDASENTDADSFTESIPATADEVDAENNANPSTLEEYDSLTPELSSKDKQAALASESDLDDNLVNALNDEFELAAIKQTSKHQASAVSKEKVDQTDSSYEQFKIPSLERTDQRDPSALTATASAWGVGPASTNGAPSTSLLGGPSSFYDVQLSDSAQLDEFISILGQNYTLGSDQWSQPPPGRPPAHTLLSYMNTNHIY